MARDARPSAAAAVPPWTRAQRGAAFLAAFAVLIDGFDSQLMSLTLPAIARDWGLAKGAFAGVLAIGTVGIALGAAVAGFANDRFGRRPCLIGSLILIGIANGLLAQATGLAALAAARVAVGCGIGAALASATTCLAEFTPLHRRSTVIAFAPLCMPIGGLIASTTCAALLARLGWQAMFLIGAALPIGFALVLVALLPETPPFLATRPGRAAELRRVMDRLGMAELPAAGTRKPGKLRLAGLIAGDFRRETLLVWTALFGCLLTSYIGIGWLPSLFANAGGSLALSSGALAANSGGAVVGSVLCVLFVQRLGTRRPFVAVGAFGVAAFVALALLFDAGAPVSLLFLLVGLTSSAIAITQSLLYVLLAQIYPAELRGSGVGIGMAMGRLGAVASAFVGAWALRGGGAMFFLVDAATLAATVAAALTIRKHVAPAKA